MKHPQEFTGMRWNTEELRREREDGWFAVHEAELIEAARRRREAADRERVSAGAEARRLAHRRNCPACGEELSPTAIEGIQVGRCALCEGIFFPRGELERLLVRHDAHRRGFFRKLLGLPDS